MPVLEGSGAVEGAVGSCTIGAVGGNSAVGDCCGAKGATSDVAFEQVQSNGSWREYWNREQVVL